MRGAAVLSGLAAASLLAGCGLGVEDATVRSNSAVAGLTGSAHGGQQPIVGAVVRVLAPGQTGYGSAPTVLSTSTTDGNGGFSMPAYTCPANTGIVYLVVTGGNSGSGVNSLISEAAIVGPCSSAASAFVRVSEVTTAAAAYALAPFASTSVTGTNIGTSASNQAGLNNTYAVTNLLAPNSTGMATVTPQYSGMLVAPIAYPNYMLNTVANILAACINTAGSVVSGSPCAQLLSNTTLNGTAPVDTFQAALNLARQTSSNVSALYSLTTASAPFQPFFPYAPSDFSLLIGYSPVIAYNAQVTAGTGKIAVDAAGNVYALTATSLVKVAPGGTLTSTTLANSCSAQGVAVSQAGNVYVSCSAGSVLQYSSNGALLSTITSTDLNSPKALAFDAAGNLWVTVTNGLVEYNSSGAEVAGSPFALSATPNDLAISPAAIWASGMSTTLSRVDNSNHAVLTYTESVPVYSVAVDASNNAWGASYSQDQFFTNYSTALEVSNAGALVSPAAGYPSSKVIQYNYGVAIDGLGSAYFANSTAHSLGNTAYLLSYSSTGSLLPNAVLPTNPQSVTQNSPLAVMPGKPMLDQSGNLWVPGPYGAGGYLTQVVGFGAPVVAPLAVGVASGTVGTRP